MPRRTCALLVVLTVGCHQGPPSARPPRTQSLDAQRAAYWKHRRGRVTDAVAARETAWRDWKKLAHQGPAATPNGAGTGSWQLVGPLGLDTAPSTAKFGLVSGRMTALAVDPITAGTVWGGFAQGGVWKSTDAGATWTNVTDGQSALPTDTLPIGAIAVDPQDDTLIYAGTGEGDVSDDSWFGYGLIRSTDGGHTWAPMSSRFKGLSVSKIWVDPASRDVYVSTMNGVRTRMASDSPDADPNDLGLWKTINGGVSWTAVLDQPVEVGTFEVDTSQTPYLFYFSTPGAGAFTVQNGDTVTPAQIGDIPTDADWVSFAIAPQNPQLVYAGVGLSGHSGGTLYRSSDGGQSFMELPGAPDFCGDQCDFDNVLLVDPTDMNDVFFGGGACAVWKMTDGTTDAPAYDTVSAPNACQDWTQGTVHSDLHALAVRPGGHLYAATGGGFYGSTDDGKTWTPGGSVATAQFYDVCLDPASPSPVYGGLQDNGDVAGTLATSGWLSFETGDGGGCVVVGNTLLSGLQDGLIDATPLASLDQKDGVVSFGDPNCMTPGENGCQERVAFIAPIAGSPTPGTIYTGTCRLWRTTDGGSSWTPISPDVTDAALPDAALCTTDTSTEVVTAIAVAPSKPTTLWTGASDGVIALSVDGGQHWKVVSGATLPPRWVSAIAVDPTNDAHAWVAFAGYGAGSTTPGHLFVTSNAGTDWTAVDPTGTTDLPIESLVAHPFTAGLLYAGSDHGVLESTDGAQSWHVAGQGLPNVAVYALAVHPETGVLVAGTHGRAAWSIPVGGGSGVPVDMSVPVDLATMPDLAGHAAVDMMSVDLPVADLGSGDLPPVDMARPDLVLPSEMAVAGDLASAPDMASPVADLARPSLDDFPPDDVLAPADDQAVAADLAVAAAPDLARVSTGSGKAASGCGCRVSSHAPTGGAPLLAALLALATLVTRRGARRSRPRSRGRAPA